MPESSEMDGDQNEKPGILDILDVHSEIHEGLEAEEVERIKIEHGEVERQFLKRLEEEELQNENPDGLGDGEVKTKKEKLEGVDAPKVMLECGIPGCCHQKVSGRKPQCVKRKEGKQYRLTQNTGLENLKAVVPSLQKVNFPTRPKILSHAIDYIRSLETQGLVLEDKLRKAQCKNELLKQRLMELGDIGFIRIEGIDTSHPTHLTS